jgi:hypothetical protein
VALGGGVKWALVVPSENLLPGIETQLSSASNFTEKTVEHITGSVSHKNLAPVLQRQKARSNQPSVHRIFFEMRGFTALYFYDLQQYEFGSVRSEARLRY